MFAGDDVLKINKVTSVPLGSDIKVFRDYLIEQGNKMASILKADNHNSTAFRALT